MGFIGVTLPAMILSWADLAEFSETLVVLSSYRPDCVLLFVPEACAKDTAKWLMAVLDKYIKDGVLSLEHHGSSGSKIRRNLYAALLYAIRVLQRNLGIPIVLFNFPSPDNAILGSIPCASAATS